MVSSPRSAEAGDTASPCLPSELWPIAPPHTADVLAQVRSVLGSRALIGAYAGMSYAHVNGFVALTIAATGSTTRRLHWWPQCGSSDSPIHSHARSFTSRVVSGALRLTHYREGVVAGPHALVLDKYLCSSGEDQSGYRFVRDGVSYLSVTSRFSIAHGSTYSLHSSQIHSVRPLEETITDVWRGPNQGTSAVYAAHAMRDFNNAYLEPAAFAKKLEALRWRLQ